MVFVGGAILPHGPLVFDGDPNSTSLECRQRYAKLSESAAERLTELYEGTCKAAEELVNLDPDLIIIHTPEGISLGSSVGVYLADSAEGTAEWNGCWDDFKAAVELDKDTSERLVKHLRKNGVAADGIQAYAGLAQPLRWAEVIPCWYIKRTLKKDVKYIIMTQALKNNSFDIPSEVDNIQLRTGECLAAFVDELPQRVAIIVSGDLAHLHEPALEDPLYLPDPRIPYKPVLEIAEKFDRACIAWAKSADGRRDDDASVQDWDAGLALPWLHIAAPLHNVVSSCGFVGMVMLHGFLDAHAQAAKKVIKSKFIIWQVPSYFGMMVATFTTK